MCVILMPRAGTVKAGGRITYQPESRTNEFTAVSLLPFLGSGNSPLDRLSLPDVIEPRLWEQSAINGRLYFDLTGLPVEPTGGEADYESIIELITVFSAMYASPV